ncbi:hypothetical protein SASPL_139440 [Salvia splendens]|uniref:HIG1 domain-containing protein n=1 Tax=Salvia splendens TaxID=180675 RepID=A0A8X8WNE2_SALSN|nr:hypothetical protein SASPL_139440 [Salvia splendens]
MAFKYTVVGGVAIPNYVKGFAALTGLSGGVSYWFHHELKSKYGENHPDTFTRFMTGHVALAAGATAHLFSFKKDLKMKAIDDNEAGEVAAV